MAPVKSVCLRTHIEKSEQPRSDHFEVKEADEAFKLQDGQVLVNTLYLSLDPILRYKMSRESFMTPWPIGEPCVGVGVGFVLQSKFPGIVAQDIVESRDFPFKTQFVTDGKSLNKVLTFLTNCFHCSYVAYFVF